MFVLKCDIKKFFASVDHEVLMQALACKIQENDFLWLLGEIIASFQIEDGIQKGMPIGNLTSQLFANIYMNPLDQYVKHELKVNYYIRYADDFVILSDDKSYLKNLIAKIEKFLKEEIKLSLHPNKVSIRNYYLGVDFFRICNFPQFYLAKNKNKKKNDSKDF